MTYPDRSVRAAVASRFVAVRLNIKHPKVREFSVIWMPTLLIADKRGVVHYRSVSSLPPEDLLDVLDLGEAQARMRSGEYARAETLLADGLARRERGPSTDELIFWHGVARYYLDGQRHAGRDRIWRRLIDEFPESIWTRRIPSTLGQRR